MELAFLVITGWLLCVCVHEFAHALVAYIGGDESVRSKGYLSFNILRYVDPAVTLVIPAIAMAMGWIALPGAAVYINESKLRNRFWRSAVAAAGPAATFLCSYLIAQLISQHYFVVEPWVKAGLAVIIVFNVASTFLNLMPFPPLDGFGIIEPWLPSSVQQKVRTLPTGISVIAIMLLISYVPFLNDALWSGTFAVVEWLDVPRRYVAAGYEEFRQNSLIVLVAVMGALFVFSRLKKGSGASPAGSSGKAPAPARSEEDAASA